MDFAEGFTPGAKAVLEKADEQARRLNHNYLGTEHILLAFAASNSGSVSQLFIDFSVDPSKVIATTEYIIGKGDKPVQGEIGLTPRAKYVVELAIEETRRQRAKLINEEHLFLGLLKEGEGVAVGILESFGITFEKVSRNLFVSSTDEEFLKDFLLRMKQSVVRLAENEDLFNQLEEEGNRYRKRREAVGLTRQEVARRAGIYERELSFFENGFVHPDDMPDGFIAKLDSILK